MSLSIGDVERALRDELVSGRVSLSARPLFKNYATVDLSSSPKRITVDPDFGGLVENVIHELLHVVYQRRLEQWGGLEEVIVVALECAVVGHITRNKERSAWWRRAIANALKP